MATVYLAVQENLGREVALKVMAAELAADTSFGVRFQREAQVSSRLQHPNIVTIYDVGVHDQNFYLSMEYLDGTSLADCGQDLSREQVLRAVTDIASALDFAGSKGYVHRDVKPQNIIIQERHGRAVLMDFGIVMPSGPGSDLTSTGLTIGTPYYMSPEQARGEAVDSRSDLYSLGVVLYWLLAGRVPFAGDSPVATVLQHVTEPAPPLPQDQASLQWIVDRALAKSPEERFQTGAEMIEALRSALEALGPGPSAPAPASPAAASPVPSPAPDTAAVARGGLFSSLFGIPIHGVQRLIARFSGKIASDDRAADPAGNNGTGNGVPAPGETVLPRPNPAPDAPPVGASDPGTADQIAAEEEIPDDWRMGKGSGADAAAAPAGVAEPDLEGADFGTQIIPISELPARLNDPVAAVPLDATMMYPTPGHRATGEHAVGAALLVVRARDPALAGRRFNCGYFPFSVGRSETADLSIGGDTTVSRRHLVIDRDERGFSIRDTSSNGLSVGGRILQREVRTLPFETDIKLSDRTLLRFVANLPALPDLTGQVLVSRFRLRQVLHSGMKATTYAADDQGSPGRTLAIKIFSPQLLSLPLYQEGFRRQTELMARLQHPHICRVLDFGHTTIQVDGASLELPYLCMDWMQGGSLTAWLEQEVPDIPTVLAWVEKLTLALQYTHGEGIAHGDIKPGSVVFDLQGNPYLTDFAMALARDSVASTTAGVAEEHPEAEEAVVIGSPAFLAPEQWEGQPPSSAADQYSLAVLVVPDADGQPSPRGPGRRRGAAPQLRTGADSCPPGGPAPGPHRRHGGPVPGAEPRAECKSGGALPGCGQLQCSPAPGHGGPGRRGGNPGAYLHQLPAQRQRRVGQPVRPRVGGEIPLQGVPGYPRPGPGAADFRPGATGHRELRCIPVPAGSQHPVFGLGGGGDPAGPGARETDGARIPGGL